MEITEIYAHYRDLVHDNLPKVKCRILKADAWNEAEGGYKSLSDVLPVQMTSYLELNIEVVKRAAANHPEYDIRHGDIRHLPFEDGIFGAIFDMSTIDHIPSSDVPRAIDEYWRCLMPGGTLVMVSWCSDFKREEPIDWDGPQYFHQEQELRSALSRGFEILHSDIFHRSGHEASDYLIEFVARKVE